MKNNEPIQPISHLNHRQRQKSKFLEHGLDTFKEHEILEAMLFYTIPQKDTKPIAYELINTFGSLKQVLEAPYEKLLEVKGIGEKTASFIVFSKLLAKKYLNMSIGMDGVKTLNSSEVVLDYCKAKFLGDKVEKVWASVVDNNLNVIEDVLVNKGSISSAEVNPRRIVEIMISRQADSLILTHNHPMGTCLPSKDDVAATKHLIKTLQPLDIRLVDHVIVGRDGSISMRNSSYCAELW